MPYHTRCTIIKTIIDEHGNRRTETIPSCTRRGRTEDQLRVLRANEPDPLHVTYSLGPRIPRRIAGVAQ